MDVWTYHDDGSKDAAADQQNAYQQLKMATPGVTESAPSDADDSMEPGETPVEAVYGPTGRNHPLYGRNI